MYQIIGNSKLAYTDTGSGLTLLFIHGYPLSRNIWQPQVQGLSDSYRILAPDLPGHGDSDPTPGPHSMDSYADTLAALLDSLDITEKVVICGLSMGGYITFAFYRKYPDRVAAIILAATRAAADTPQGKAARQISAETARAQGLQAIVDGMLPKMFAAGTLPEHPELVTIVREIMQSISVDGVVGDLLAMKERPDSRPFLNRIQVPVLLLHGIEDQIIPIQEVFEMASTIPGAQLHQVQHAGHLLNLEQPEQFNIAIKKFLAELENQDEQ